MAETKSKFNIFGPVTKGEIRVGYISSERGYVQMVDLCEANRYEKNNPGTTFIYQNRDKVIYLDIQGVNDLLPSDLKPTSTSADGGCSGLELESECGKRKTVVDFYGGGGVGVVGNPIIGTDGAVLAVDIVQGGFGYQYPPIVEVKNPCGIGDGSLLKSILSDEGYTVETLKYYNPCGDESDLDLCPDSEVKKAGWGRLYDRSGKDIGPWDPSKYTDRILKDPIDLEMDAYKKALAEFKNPFWTTRSNTPVTITSDDKVTNKKYDVYGWWWGSKPKVNPKGPIDNLYIKLFGRRGEPRGLEYWRDIQSSGKNLTQIEKAMKTFPEWIKVCRGECRPNMPDCTYLFGQYYEYDKNNFMNKNAVSPEPMSNVIGTDGGGKMYSMEWNIDFPYDGNYTFIAQCDNEGTLFVDGEKQSEYNIGAGGAKGNTLSPPTKKMVPMKKGIHPVRFDLVNLQGKKKVVVGGGKGGHGKTELIDFRFTTATLHGATAEIHGLDMYIEKKFGPTDDMVEAHAGNVRKNFKREVEYGKVYDVTLTSNTFRTQRVGGANGNQITYIGLKTPGDLRYKSPTRLEFDDNSANGFDVNGSFTIDRVGPQLRGGGPSNRDRQNLRRGQVTFAEDGKSLILKEGSNVEVTLTYTWNDIPGYRGKALDQIKIGTTTWTQADVKRGSVTRTITLNGSVELGGDETKNIALRTKGANVLQMEDIPHVPIEDQKILFDDVILWASKGRFHNIRGNKAKYVLDPILPVDRKGKDIKVFDTLSSIDKASRKLWKTNNLSPQQRKDSANSFKNRYGITPFNPTVEHNTNYPGFHAITWTNVKVPITTEYEITVAVDDNVRIRIGDQVDIKKDGFAVRGNPRTATGTSVYKKTIKAGTYTLIADLEQIPGGKFAMNSNPMVLAIDIRAAGNIDMVVEKKSWLQNPMAVSLAIEAPAPPPPERALPEDDGDGQCPSNPIWSTMSPGASSSWYPAEHKKWSEFTNDNALSPVAPLNILGTDGVGVLYRNSWRMVAPYEGIYTLKGTAEDAGKVIIDGTIVAGDGSNTALASPTEKCRKVPSAQVFLSEGSHTIEVELENKKDYETPKYYMDQKIFNTKDWQNQKKRISGKTKDIDFRFTTATLHGATAEIKALGMYIEKAFGTDNVRKEFKRAVEYGKIYDVVLTSNTFRTERTGAGNSNQITYIGLKKPGDKRWSSNTRLEFDDHSANGFDVNGSFTIDRVNGGTAKFNSTGDSIEYTGSNVQVTLTYTWNDNPKTRGKALEQIKIGSQTWTQGSGATERYTYVKRGDQGVWGLDENDRPKKGIVPRKSWALANTADRYNWDKKRWEVKGKRRWLPTTWEDLENDAGGDEGWVSIPAPPPPTRAERSKGNETHTITLGGSRELGSDASGSIELRTKGDNVLQMEDIPHVPIEDQKILFDDVILWASEGKFFGIVGNKAKYVLPHTQSRTLNKNGITYNGPALYNYKHKAYGKFVNNDGVSPDYPKFGGGELVNYEWSNVDFPADGEYDFHFANDAHGSLYFDGKEEIRGDFDKIAGVSKQDSDNWKVGIKKKIKVSKGKHTLTVAPSHGRIGETTGWADGLFKKISSEYYRGQQAWDNNPSAFALSITRKVETTPAAGSREEMLQRGKSWQENPTAISAILVPPPCKKRIKGKGVVVDVEIDDPGGPYPTPEDPDDPTYPVMLRLKRINIKDPGINYDPGPGGPTFPPFPPPTEDTPSSDPDPNLEQGDEIIVDPPNGFKGYPEISSHGSVTGVVIIDPGGGWTEYPTISMPSDTGIGVVFAPQFEIVRDPLGVPPDKLLQVTDLVGLKKTGYVEGRAYYGTVFYKDNVKYAGLYETAGQSVRVYDTLQDSIDSMDRSEPSAIQRAGTDISSNDPRLNIPNTPDNLV